MIFWILGSFYKFKIVPTFSQRLGRFIFVNNWSHGTVTSIRTIVAHYFTWVVQYSDIGVCYVSFPCRFSPGLIWSLVILALCLR